MCTQQDQTLMCAYYGCVLGVLAFRVAALRVADIGWHGDDSANNSSFAMVGLIYRSFITAS